MLSALVMFELGGQLGHVMFLAESVSPPAVGGVSCSDLNLLVLP